MILIADAKQPTRILLQQTVLYAGTDLFFSIQPDAPAQVDKTTATPRPLPAAGLKVKITPAKAATTPPPGGGLGVVAPTLKK